MLSCRAGSSRRRPITFTVGTTGVSDLARGRQQAQWQIPSAPLFGYSQINLEKRVEFAGEAEAENAGYMRAGNCP